MIFSVIQPSCTGAIIVLTSFLALPLRHSAHVHPASFFLFIRRQTSAITGELCCLHLRTRSGQNSQDCLGIQVTLALIECGCKIITMSVACAIGTSVNTFPINRYVHSFQNWKFLDLAMWTHWGLNWFFLPNPNFAICLNFQQQNPLKKISSTP